MSKRSNKSRNQWPKLVDVVWSDACASADWEASSSAAQPSVENTLVRTVGFLVQKTKEFIVVSTTVTEWGSGNIAWAGTMQIPRPLIKEMQEVEWSPPKLWRKVVLEEQSA